MLLGICAIFLGMFGIVFQTVLPKTITVIIFGISVYLCYKAWEEDERKEEAEREMLGMGKNKASRYGNTNWQDEEL